MLDTFWWDGPKIKITFAPKFAALLAIETPIFPDEKFEINLTLSIFSIVGPAVIRTVLPFKGDLSFKSFSIKSTIFSGSSIRPSPTNPLANSPDVGGINMFDIDVNLLIFSLVELCWYISKSIAGAK